MCSTCNNTGFVLDGGLEDTGAPGASFEVDAERVPCPDCPVEPAAPTPWCESCFSSKCQHCQPADLPLAA